MTPRSVTFVTPGWTRDGGVSAHVKASAAALAHHGVTVEVFATGVDDDPVAGVHVHHSPRLLDADAPFAERLPAGAIAATDLVHVHHIDDPDLVAGLRAAAPVVISAHGYPACTSGVYHFQPGHECVRGHGPGCVPNLMFRGCAHTAYPKTLPRKYLRTTRARDALRLADLTVSYSSAVDRHLAANGLGARAIVPYFPTMAARPATGHEHRRLVVFAGRIVRPKGVGVLIRAAAQVDARFVLGGEGRDSEALSALADELGIADRVDFAGWLGPEALAGALGEASVVVMPSLWPEPFGIVGIEGFAAGRPAVASATGGIGDWCEHGVSGLTVPPGDVGALAGALNELLDDPARQAEMGAAGKAAVAERFSAQRHVELLLEAYEQARSRWERARPAAA